MLKKLHSISRSILKKEKSRGKIAITITDDAHVRALNKRYRKINKATDVLSFYMGEDGILGDIVISKDTAMRNAKRFGSSPKAEMKRLAIHGTLHLLGFGHINRLDRMIMRRKEDLYAKKIL